MAPPDAAAIKLVKLEDAMRTTPPNIASAPPL